MTNTQTPHVQNPAVVIGGGGCQISDSATKLLALVVITGMAVSGALAVVMLFEFGSAVALGLVPVLVAMLGVSIAALQRWRPRPPP